MHMESVFNKITPFMKGRASYYNHNGPDLPLESPSFKNGVEFNPAVTEDDKDFLVKELADVKGKFNPQGILVKSQGVGYHSDQVECSCWHPTPGIYVASVRTHFFALC